MSQMILTSPIRKRMTHPERPAPVEQRCVTPGCTATHWTVQLLSAANSLWRVSSATGGSYLVAGVTPACPWCGADLLATPAPTDQLADDLLLPVSEAYQPSEVVGESKWN